MSENRSLKKRINRFFFPQKSASKHLNIFDTFLRISFVVLAFSFVVTTLLILTSPNQFTKELVYRKDDTLVYDSKDRLIGKIGLKREHNEHVLNIGYDELNQGLINSVVATEDATFFRHNGVDLLNTVESGFKTKVLQTSTAGGSSITQQIIGETHLGRQGNSSIVRKIREIYLAIISEFHLNKTQIMSSYFNYFEYGQDNIRGVELASNYFFDKHTYEMDYVQSSILVGTLNSPTYSNPLGGVNPETKEYYNNSQKRLETVLLANYNQGYLIGAEYYLLQQVKVADTLDLNRATNINKYQDFIDVVAREVQEKYQINPFVEPIEIYTTMDRSAQSYATKLRDMKEVVPPNDKINFGFVVSKTQTGEIVALSGGKQYRKNGLYLFNNAIDNKQQPGSAFKPIAAYSPTFEYLHWSDRSPISNEPYRYPNTGEEVFNHDRTSGGIMTMDAALANSRNLTALRALEAVSDEIGFAELTAYLNRFGFDFAKDEVVPSYALGALKYGVTPLEMNAAYQAFGNGGYYIEPYTIRYVKDENKEKIANDVAAESIIDKRTAFMMSTALERSTKVVGAYVNTAGYYETPYIGKTGTSNWDESAQQYGIPNLAPKDTWFAGYTSEYTMSVWGGYDLKEIKQGYYPDYASGAHDYSARLWGAMMKQMINGKEKSYLTMELPSGLEESVFDPKTPAPFRKYMFSRELAYFYTDNLPASPTSFFDQFFN